MWLYGYFLRFKWVSYFNKNNKNFISYTYQIKKYLMSIPNNYLVNDIFSSALYVQEEVTKLFIEAHGYYRYNFLQNFNLFYWIKLIIYLPQHIILYLNPKSKRKTLHIFNLLYWLGSALFTIYNNEITAFIKQAIELLIEFF